MKLPVVAVAAACLSVAGCYFDRMTLNYSELPDLSTAEDDAVIGESGRNDEDAARIRKRLMELDMEEIIAEIAKNLRLNKHDPQSHALDDLLHTVSCKSAIRGNDKNTPEELQALADRVYSDDTIRHCPHGRPVIFTLSKSNIERQFGRA